MSGEDEQVPVTVTAVEIVDGVEVPIGGYPSEDGYDHAAAELADRRQRAREAGLDAYSLPSSRPVGGALDAAIKAATRVRITPEIYNAAVAAQSAPNPQGLRGAIKAAFEAAGFEVEQ